MPVEKNAELCNFIRIEQREKKKGMEDGGRRRRMMRMREGGGMWERIGEWEWGRASAANQWTAVGQAEAAGEQRERGC